MVLLCSSRIPGIACWQDRSSRAIWFWGGGENLTGVRVQVPAIAQVGKFGGVHARQGDGRVGDVALELVELNIKEAQLRQGQPVDGQRPCIQPASTQLQTLQALPSCPWAWSASQLGQGCDQRAEQTITLPVSWFRPTENDRSTARLLREGRVPVKLLMLCMRTHKSELPRHVDSAKVQHGAHDSAAGGRIRAM